MKCYRLFPLIAVLGFVLNPCSVTGAPLKNQIIQAARQLGEQPSYGWTATVKNNGEGNFRQGPTHGKTEKDGYTHYKLTLGDNEVEVARHGEKIAFHREGEWMAPEDLDERQGRLARMLERNKVPAQEADSLAAISRELKQQADGSYSGALTELGIKSLYFNFQRANMEVKGVSGNVTFWLKEGRLIKYTFQIKGNLSWNQGERQFDMDRTTTVEIKDVGKAKVSLPDAAKEKLS